VTVHDLPPANAGVDEDMCAGAGQQLQAGGGVTYEWFPPTGLSNANIANPIATLDGTASYTVLVTDANGCQASDFMILTVHQLPTVAASAGNNTICLGDTAYVVAIGAQLYQWSPNLFISSVTGAAVNVWPTSDFTWTVNGTDVFGCVNDTTVTITVEPPPPAPTVTNNGAQVSSTAANGYQWYLNGQPIGGATEQNWIPLVNGNYSVEITDTNGCSSMSLPVYFGTVGFTDMTAAGLRVYPQPMHDVLRIDGLKENAASRVIDLRGRTVWQGTVAAGQGSVIDLGGVATGSYTLVLLVAGSFQRVPLIKE